MSAETQRRDDEIDDLDALLQPGKEDDLKTFLLLLHPADVADLIAEVDAKKAQAILAHLSAEQAAELFSELEPVDQLRLVELGEPEQVAEIVGEMESDDLADLLQTLPDAQAKGLLETLPDEDREDVTELMAYDEESAGGIMQTELVSVEVKKTVADAMETLRREAKEIDVLSIFVVDDKKRYLGNVALQNLVFADPGALLEDVMEAKVVDVTTDVDQEEVARVFDHYGLVELGVVDRVGRLRGRITADDVHEVIVEEAEEDMMLMTGTAAEPEVVYSGSVLRVAGARLPWLFATFFGGIAATAILNAASAVFATQVILLTFVPVITGMSGNVGTQSAMIMIRGMALGHIAEDGLKKSIGRDFLVGLVISLTCGLGVTLIVAVWQGEPWLGICVGVALFASMLTASLLGAVEPVILERFGIDPAIAAGPVITSVNDVTGVTIYALIASEFVGRLG